MSRIFRFGRSALHLYAEIHQNTINQILHGLGMPFVGYAIMGGLPILLTRLCGYRYGYIQTLAMYRICIYLTFVLYYLTFDFIGGIVTGLTYAYPLYRAAQDSQWKMPKELETRGLLYYACILATSIAIQEGIGHTFFEHANSDLWQLPNSISIAPLFGTRALLHNIFGLPLVPGPPLLEPKIGL